MNCGARVRAYREGQKMSQETLARETGIVASSISKIENGHRKLTLEEAVRVAAALMVCLEELAGVSKMPPRLPPVIEHGHKLVAKVKELEQESLAFEQALEGSTPSAPPSDASSALPGFPRDSSAGNMRVLAFPLLVHRVHEPLSLLCL